MTITYEEWRFHRNPHPGIASAIPIIALRLGLLGWGCWFMANSLAGPSPTHQLTVPLFQGVVQMSETLIQNTLANDVLHHGSLVCLLGGASVIGLRRVAFYWDAYRGKNSNGNSDQD